jgi:hypothetical protein
MFCPLEPSVLGAENTFQSTSVGNMPFSGWCKFNFHVTSLMLSFDSWDGIVGTVIRLWATWLRNYVSMPGRGKRLFSIPKHPDRLWVLPRLLFHTFALLSPAVKWLEHEVQHLLPPSAKDENKWSYNITSSTCLNGVHRDESAFTYHIHCPHFSTSIYSNYRIFR